MSPHRGRIEVTALTMVVATVRVIATWVVEVKRVANRIEAWSLYFAFCRRHAGADCRNWHTGGYGYGFDRRGHGRRHRHSHQRCHFFYLENSDLGDGRLLRPVSGARHLPLNSGGDRFQAVRD